MTVSPETPLSFDWNEVTLAGSLWVPAGDGPFPAVVMAQGSGPADRDSGGFFGEIRAAFLDRGIATFSFDKPGCGHSSGNWRNVGLEGRADQIAVALDLVRGQPAIDAERVGIWGHSQGGWVVQMLAGRPVSVAFAIANSAPTIGVRAQILHDNEHALRDRGHAENEIQQALGFVGQLFRAADEGAAYETISSRVLGPARRQSWYRDVATVDGADDWRHIGLLIGERFEPVAALAGVECPFLAVYGGLDRLLPPWRGAQETGRALAANPDATVVVFPGGDHRLQNQQTGRFVDGYLDLLADWASHRVR